LTHQLVSGKSKLKKSTILYLSSIILGIVLLALVLVGTYLDAVDALNILVSFSPTKLGFGFMLGSIVLLTVGIVGIGRQYFNGHRRLFTVLASILVPPLIFFSLFYGCVSAVIMAPMFPLRSEITQVTVVDDNPLVLSLCVKAITSRDTRIDSAFILDRNDTLVASYWNEEIMVKGVSTFEPICVLPAGSEITVSVDFNTTLPSGGYLVRLSSWHDNHGESPFTIP
jgi:hypothetical protein